MSGHVRDMLDGMTAEYNGLDGMRWTAPPEPPPPPQPPEKRRATIRQITTLDQVPPFPPRRYRSSHGYIRLRWRIGPWTYLECYEHRLAAGFPPPARPAIDDAVVARHYATGLSTGQIARLLGATPAGVWRSLRRSGTPIRSHTQAAALRRNPT
jgi:hypothetical protein